MPIDDIKMSFQTVSAVKRGEQVTITLNQQQGANIYSRTYQCSIDANDRVTFPNDLTMRIQTLLTAVCLCAKYPNTYEGDSIAVGKAVESVDFAR
jgi:hypothetical protein